MDVSKEDIERLHEKIEKVAEATDNKIGKLADVTNVLAVSVQKITTTLEYTKMPVRPCNELKDHLESHKQTVQLWYSPVIKAFIHIIELGVVALATWFLTK